MKYKILLALLAGLVTRAAAGVLTYSDPSVFSSAVPIVGTITFEGLGLGGYGSPITAGQLYFYGTSVGIAGSLGPGTGEFFASLNSTTVSPLSVDLGTIYGIGFDIGCYSCTGNLNDTVVVTDTGGNTFTFSVPTLNNFWGVSSDLAIASIGITVPSYGYVSLDNVSYGGAANSGGTGDTGDAPEVETVLLIGSGLALLACRRHRDDPCSRATA